VSRKKKTEQSPDEYDLWIAPNHTLKGLRGDRPWDHMREGTPSHGRYLELADIALGLKKPTPKAKCPPVHEKIKS
jgi:hypothetical protein